MRRSWTVACLVFVACRPVEAPAALVWISKQPTPVGPTLPAARYHGISAADQGTLQLLHQWTQQVVLAPDFAATLGDLDAIEGRPGGDPLSGRRAAEIYLGRDPQRQYRPICYSVGGKKGGGETAATGLQRMACAGAAEEVAAFVTLRPVTMQRAASAVREERACAINTLAHEWTHAVATTTPGGLGFAMVFLDEDHQFVAGPVASYTIGALAQCLHLAKAHAPVTFDVRACMSEVGIRDFNAGTCAAKWSCKFLPAGSPC